jgi:colanic acid/amylovoran biosynthesis glycosyltransferase
LRILYLSDHGPYSNTFIRQDVEIISKSYDTLYLCFEEHKHFENKIIKTKVVKYPSSSFKNKIRWRLEKYNFLFNWTDKKFARKLKSEIKNFNPSIIHCQFSYESVKLLQNFQSKTPIILNFRGYGASSKLKNKHYVYWLRSIATKKNIYPIFVCEYLKKNLLDKKIRFTNEGIVLYTGINQDLFKRTEYRTKNNVKTFIQVGAFNDKKGQEVTIKAFAKFISTLELKKYNLVFIGGGKNLNKCKKLVKELKIEKSVVFKGHLTQIEIIKELEKSAIFVHHSLTAANGDQEGIPNAILEAMSMQMPILTTYHSGIPEAVIHNKNGLLCNENDIETYSRQMLEISNWQLLAENRKKIKEHFSIDLHIKKLKSFYDYIAKK